MRLVVGPLIALQVISVVSVTLLPGATRADEPAPSAIPTPVPEPTSANPPAPQASPPVEKPAYAAIPDTTDPKAPSKATPPKAPPYSLPWQLRPVIAPTVLRIDSTLSTYEDAAARPGRTVATGLTGSYKIPGTGGPGSGLAVIGRLMLVDDSPPETPPTVGMPPAPTGGAALVNPLLGAAYAMKLGNGFRTNFFFGVTLPIGMGGGATPDKGQANSRAKGINARAGMDNALFAVNDLTVIPGASIAYVNHNLTVQLEATLLHLMRTRGEAVQKEATKTNFTTGLHVGYFFHPAFSVGTELRYQRWLNAPFAVENDKTGALIDNLTWAIGPRFHIKAGPVWIRPGLAYWRGLDKPLAAATPNYHSVQFDVPILF